MNKIFSVLIVIAFARAFYHDIVLGESDNVSRGKSFSLIALAFVLFITTNWGSHALARKQVRDFIDKENPAITVNNTFLQDSLDLFIREKLRNLVDEPLNHTYPATVDTLQLSSSRDTLVFTISVDSRDSTRYWVIIQSLGPFKKEVLGYWHTSKLKQLPFIHKKNKALYNYN